MEEDDYDQEEEEDEDELDDLQPHLMWGHHGARAAAANVASCCSRSAFLAKAILSSLLETTVS